MILKNLFCIISIHFSLLLLLNSYCGCSLNERKSTDSLLSEDKFAVPPLEARPGVLWPWLNGHVDLGQITLELEEMKAKGLRGAIIWDIGSLVDPDHIIPIGPAFLSDESLKAIHHAIDEATRLGLELGIVASSSWNAGGEWIEPEDASKALRWSEIRVKGPSSYSELMPLPEKTGKHFFDIAVLAMPLNADKSISHLSSVINLNEYFDSQGRLTWDVPAGEWRIIRFICSNTEQGLVCPSPNSDGLVIDHLNKKAAEKHFLYMINKLMQGRQNLEALKFFMLDSYEVWEALDWTPDFIEEFTDRYGYDPTAYLPLLTGWQLSNAEITNRFLHDWNKTVADLIVEEHFRSAREILNDHGLLLLAEAGHGGSARVDALKALGSADIPMGEFWNHQRFWVTKEAASAAHIYGRKLVNAESLTGWQHWQDGPSGYKRLFDVALCAGLNQVTFHTFTHNPPGSGYPGYTYHAGEHFNIKSTWWNNAKPMLDYMARCCYMLQQGLFIADVCFYYGDQAPNLVPSRRIDPSLTPRYDASKCYHCGKPKPIRTESLGLSYDYDYVNEEVIKTRMSVSEGKIILPDGISYNLLVLPEREDISLDVLQKIGEMVKAGATVVGPKPTRSNSLKNYPECDNQVKSLAEKIWGVCDGDRIKQNHYGKGNVFWNVPLDDLLQQMNIIPDFKVTNITNQDRHIDYIHRKTDREDIYFVSNSSYNWEDISCMFRVEADRVPFLCNPDDGTIKKIGIYQIGKGTISLKLKMAPISSVFVVFRKAAHGDYIKELEKTMSENSSPGENQFEWEPIEILSEDQELLRTRVMTAGKYVFKTSKGKMSRVEVDNLPGVIYPESSWVVKFPDGWGAPDSIRLNQLISWTNFSEQGIKYFSGTALYSNQFRIPDSLLDKKYSLLLDIGDAHELAEVFLNGQKLAVLWKKPFRADMTIFVRPGLNRLEIFVTNLWNNRIIGDLHSDTEQIYTFTNIKNRFRKTSPLLASGLIGPVIIVPALNITSRFEVVTDEF